VDYGIPIQKLFKELNIKLLQGTLVACLSANETGLLLDQRKFNDETDLNHISPGKRNGD